MPIPVRINARRYRKLVDNIDDVAHAFEYLSDPLELIGINYQGSREEVFEKEGDPIRWKKSKRAEKQSGKTLQDTRTMLNSLTSSTQAGSFFETTRRQLEVGTTIPYAGVHNEGSRFRFRVLGQRNQPMLPQREFMNLRPTDFSEMVEIMEKWQLGTFEELV